MYILRLYNIRVYGIEKAVLRQGRGIVQPGTGKRDDMCAEGLCRANLQGEAFGICHRVDAACP